jgi:hypothetical protein
MSSRERQPWTDFVREREARKGAKPARKRRTKKHPEPSQAELDAMLDELTREAPRSDQR